MAARIHKILELFNRQEGEIFEEYKRIYSAAIDEVKQFDFGYDGDITTKESRQALYDYARDLAEHGLLKLPYEVTYFTRSGDVSGHRCDETYLCLAMPNTKDVIVYNTTISVKHETILGFAKIKLRISEKEMQFIEGFKFDWDRATKFKFYRSYDEKDKWIPEIICQRILVLLGLLESPSIEMRSVGSNSSVNKRREKKGLPPINPVNEVIIRLNGVRYTSDGKEAESHGTKRAHWRRGHVRRLASGQLTNVRPCLVAFTGNENVPEQVYKVTA